MPRCLYASLTNDSNHPGLSLPITYAPKIGKINMCSSQYDVLADRVCTYGVEESSVREFSSLVVGEVLRDPWLVLDLRKIVKLRCLELTISHRCETPSLYIA